MLANTCEGRDNNVMERRRMIIEMCGRSVACCLAITDNRNALCETGRR